jgi:recombinational DNA repair ATPase RecF
MHLTLTNYRCFDTASFEIPNGDFIIMDSNGSGKTSILSAIYSLHTGKPLPNTKFPEYLKTTKDYFGISTDDSEWFINGKIGPSGRLSTKYSKPNQTKHTVLTYQPNDNYWLQQSRTSKLSTLDQIIGQTNTEYLTLISNLDKICKSKLSLLKESNLSGRSDMIMVNYYGNEILNLSKQIWSIRWNFLLSIQNQMLTFTSMINCPITDWQIQTEITGANGNKINIQNLGKYKITNNEIERSKNSPLEGESTARFPCEVLSEGWQSQTDGVIKIDQHHIYNLQNLDKINFEQLWQRELICEKVLFGANRDDFSFINNKLKIEQVLSRGEIRLFVLWVKKLGIEPGQTIWLLDDIFNELDDEREQFLMSNIFMGCKQIIATGTRCSLSNLEQKSVQSLRTN